MKLIKTLFFSTVIVFVANAAMADPQNDNNPWMGNLNSCVDENWTLQETRQFCEDIFLEFFGWDLLPPIVVTHCPPDGAADNGGKPNFSPNAFCPLTCGEGTVEIGCTVKNFE